LLLCFAAVNLLAQDDSDPGRVFIAGSNPSIEQNTNAFQPLFQPQFNPVTQGSGAIAEQITPDIQTLAGNLGYRTRYEWSYLYSALEVDGANASVFLCLPGVSLEMSRLFLEQVSKRDLEAEH